MNEAYYNYLKTDKWKHIAEIVKKRASYRCQLCNTDEKLVVHHRTYDNVFDELNHLGDLICLCAAHHELCHFPPTFKEVERNKRKFLVVPSKPPRRPKPSASVVAGQAGHVFSVARDFAMSDLNRDRFISFVKDALFRGWDMHDMAKLAKTKTWPAFKSIVACDPELV